jgi:hypothetical protein
MVSESERHEKQLTDAAEVISHRSSEVGDAFGRAETAAG